MIDGVVLVAAAAVPLVLLAPWAAGRSRREAASSRRRDPHPMSVYGSGSGDPGHRPQTRRAWIGVMAAAVVPVTGWAVGLPVPIVVLTPVMFLVARGRLAKSRREREERARDRVAPDLLDLLAVAAAAGHPPHLCLKAVVDRAPAQVRAPVLGTCRMLDGGVPLAEAVIELRRGLGWLGEPVADALVDAFRSGTPLQPALARIGEVARDRRRREGEAEARKLPVLLLFPLVCCVLPAFGLLAVVPLVAVSVRSVT